MKNSKLKLLLTGTALITLASACGSPQDEQQGSNLAGTGTLAGSSVAVNVSYKYENAQPVMVNGKPVLAHKYWSCVDKVTVTYPQAMRLQTVLGNTLVQGQYNMRRALVLTGNDSTFRTFTFSTGGISVCNDFAPANRVTVAQGVYSVSGARLGADKDTVLAFPASRDTVPAAAPLPDSSTEAPSTLPQADYSAPVTASTNTRVFTVTPDRLNAALAGLRAWEKTERSNTIYGSTAIKLMPLDNLLKPYAQPNRERQYGAPDTLYALRRAGKFMQLLYPDLQTIPVADLSEPDGSTPHYGDTQLHPDGAHRGGTDVDVSYLTIGSGNDANAPYHWERNFWFLYGMLETTGIDMVLTSYKDTFVQMAKDAYNQGLVNGHAVGRVATALMADSNLNHDKHFHFAVSNLLNDNKSRRFTAADDVYTCYLALRPDSTNGAYNYCDAK